jgi:hypothetical protein
MDIMQDIDMIILLKEELRAVADNAKKIYVETFNKVKRNSM